MDMFFGVWIGLIVVFVAFAAFMARLSFASKPTAEDNLADDRWFKVTQWMDADEKWKDDVDNAIDNLGALHTWTEKVAGQLEKIGSQVERIDKFCNLDAYAKTFVTIPSSGRADADTAKAVMIEIYNKGGFVR